MDIRLVSSDFSFDLRRIESIRPQVQDLGPEVGADGESLLGLGLSRRARGRQRE
ncbi:hypothetical protein [Methylobacterium sp. CCH5-D2]|uniref:hypothetical protein n=1 Tax=Methylobacterium sp. CCH5-D2 TaxID=1768765 RepID=UPI0012E3B463|nr:hypothetical protein [Methylobacterium sp. CCH5-D2]